MAPPIGGTGFLVGVKLIALSEPENDKFYLYAVTDWHVAIQHGASVIRLNTKDGGIDIQEYGPDNWYWWPDLQDDLAVIPISALENEHYIFRFVSDWRLLDKNRGFDRSQDIH